MLRNPAAPLVVAIRMNNVSLCPARQSQVIGTRKGGITVNSLVRHYSFRFSCGFAGSGAESRLQRRRA